MPKPRRYRIAVFTPADVEVTDHALTRFKERTAWTGDDSHAQAALRRAVANAKMGNRLEPHVRDGEDFLVFRCRENGVYLYPLLARGKTRSNGITPLRVITCLPGGAPLVPGEEDPLKVSLGEIVAVKDVPANKEEGAAGRKRKEEEVAKEEKEEADKAATRPRKRVFGRPTRVATEKHHQMRIMAEEAGLSMSAMARRVGLSSSSGFYSRVVSGWSVERAMTEPTAAMAAKERVEKLRAEKAERGRVKDVAAPILAKDPGDALGGIADALRPEQRDLDEFVIAVRQKGTTWDHRAVAKDQIQNQVMRYMTARKPASDIRVFRVVALDFGFSIR